MACAIADPCAGSVAAPGSSSTTSACPPDWAASSAAARARLHERRCAAKELAPSASDCASARSVVMLVKKSTRGSAPGSVAHGSGIAQRTITA
eukprot:3964448-Prymnesium_polylepis.1